MVSRIFEGRFPGRGRQVMPALMLFTWLLATLLVSAPAEAGSTEPAGRVIFSAGDVTATDTEGFERPLTRNDVVYPGETVQTAARAMVDLRMRDNALFSLDSGSAFTVEQYGFDSGAAEVGRAVMRFLRGSLRTITGTFGKDKRDTYSMITPVATIGVRGTQYALQFCDTACARADRPAGLYGRVDKGVISVTNDAASELMALDDYFYVADSDVAPRRLVQPPEGILGAGSAGEGAAAAGDRIERPDGTGTLAGASGDLLDTTGGLLDGANGLVTGDGGLLATGGTLLQTGGGLLQQSGGLLADTGGLLDPGGGLLATGGGLLKTGGGLLDGLGTGLGGSGPLLDTTGTEPGTGGGLLDGLGGLLGLP